MWAPRGAREKSGSKEKEGVCCLVDGSREKAGEMIIEQWRRNEARVRQAGRIAIEEARRAGAPAYYHDPKAGGIVREMPDGSRQLVAVVGGQDIVMQELGPRR
jgi:hypothetical protein